MEHIFLALALMVSTYFTEYYVKRVIKQIVCGVNVYRKYFALCDLYTLISVITFTGIIWKLFF